MPGVQRVVHREGHQGETVLKTEGQWTLQGGSEHLS